MGALVDFLKRMFGFGKSELFSVEDVEASIAKDYAHFKEYGLVAEQVYSLYNGPFDPAINNYLQDHQNSIKDYFLADFGDYISMLGATDPMKQKFVLFLVYDPSYNRRIGNFMAVDEWPPFIVYEKKTEDANWQVYHELREKERQLKQK